MKRYLALFLSAAVFGSALSLAACKTQPEEPAELRNSATVTIFTTNDMHGSLGYSEKTKTVGIVKAAEIKASTPNALLVDAGDCTQGASFASVSRGADVIRMMNEAGYDVMAAGNHEFDYGKEVLLENKELAKFPILAANVKEGGALLLESSAVIEKAGYKLGFIGLTTTATSVNPDLYDGIAFTDELAAAKAEIAALKDRTDAIVLICHLGDNSVAVPRTSDQLIKALSPDERAAVAAVIDGHSHTVEEKTVEGIPVVQTGVNFTNLGRLTLEFKDSEAGATVTATGKVIDFEGAMNYEINSAGKTKGQKVNELLGAVQLQQEEILGERLCTIAAPIWGGYICYDYVESRVVETAYGDLVTDAFKHYGELFAENAQLGLPVVAVENGGGISQSLPTRDSKEVTRGDVLNAFNHGNLVEILKVSPAELRSVIEAGLVTTGQDETGCLLLEKPSGSFLQCSGFSYKYDPAGEAGKKVVEIKLSDGTALDLADTENKLLLATNSYVSSSFKQGEKLGELGGEDIIVEDYILYLSAQNGGVLDYKCNYDRILLANDSSPETYTVKLRVMNGTGDAAQAAANQTFRLFVDGAETEHSVTTDGEGYFTFTLTKGAHTLSLAEADNFVYANNYSGTGVGDVEMGYYSFDFALSAAE